MITYKLGKDINTGKIVSIQDAKKGLSCGCVCADCGKEFIAAQGEWNDWHFRHYEETDCGGGQESALHILAKKIIVENSKIILPNYGEVVYDNPTPEKKIKTIQPDVTADTSEHKLFFEIAVTHFIDYVKEKFYRQNEYKSVEIDLSKFNFLTVEGLKKEILENAENKRIIFWEKKASTDNDFLGLLGFFVLIFGLLAFFCKKLVKRNRKRR